MRKDLSTPFPCPAIDDAGLAELAGLGITLQTPDGMSIWWRNDGMIWKEIGRVVVWKDTGRIDIWPNEDLSEDERSFLAGAAWDAWFNPPTDDTFWALREEGSRTYWESVINVETTSIDKVANVIRASETRQQRQDRLFGETIAEGFDSAA
jgi:hypothetical protein